MDMKLYGICFKMCGGPDLLSYVQSGKNVPLGIMAQVLGRAGTLTQEELRFAELLSTDWKKAFGEKAPLYMGVTEEGGYDIRVSIPDPLLETVKLLTGKSYEELAGEYVSHYLKTVCGLEADILSVESGEAEPEEAAVDLSDLEEPEEEILEEVPEELPEEEVPEELPEEEPEDVSEELPEEEPAEEIPEEEPAEEIPEEEPEELDMGQKIAGIYRDMVQSIREKELDTRLGLSIGGNTQ